MAVRIVSDSACDLPPALCEELGIEIVPLTIRFGADELVDRVELTTEAFWERLARSTVLPETAAPSVGAFESTFRALQESGADGIVCINLSSRMSATMQSAQIAAKALDGVCPVSVIDSKSASMGIGMLCLEAVRARERGRRSRRRSSPRSKSRADRSHVLFTVDTLEYLRKGGRIGGAQAMLGSMLSIKPVITVQDGRGRAGRQGAHAIEGAALHRRSGEGTPRRVALTCCTRRPPTSTTSSRCSSRSSRTKIVVGEIGPVVGVHAGPATIGVTWFEPRSAVEPAEPSPLGPERR